MLHRIANSVIKEDTIEQLDKMFDGLVEAIALRSVQGMGTDETLSEIVAAVTAEMNSRGVSGGVSD